VGRRLLWACLPRPAKPRRHVSAGELVQPWLPSTSTWRTPFRRDLVHRVRTARVSRRAGAKAIRRRGGYPFRCRHPLVHPGLGLSRTQHQVAHPPTVSAGARKRGGSIDSGQRVLPPETLPNSARLKTVSNRVTRFGSTPRRRDAEALPPAFQHFDAVAFIQSPPTSRAPSAAVDWARASNGPADMRQRGPTQPENAKDLMRVFGRFSIVAGGATNAMR
jgi:hypothetical protein